MMMQKLMLALAIVAVAVVPAQARDGHEGRGGHERFEHRDHSRHFRGSFVPYAYYPYPYYVYADPYPVNGPPAVVEESPWVDPPAPVQREVVFPTGKYVLEGDGTDSYRWVWIPAVPETPPPTAPPVASPAPSKPAAADPASPRSSQRLYRWIDEHGVANWTNNWEAVPEKYRSQAKGNHPS